MAASADLFCVGIFLVWLVWLPLPFGSIVPRAFLPLVEPPLVICAAAAALRLRSHRRYLHGMAFRVWSAGGLLLLGIIALQLIPLPASAVAFLSPESYAITNRAATAAALAGSSVPARYHLSVDPVSTWREFWRVAGLLATFAAAGLLIHTSKRRRAFAVVLCFAALFEALYGVRAAALHRYAIWGWTNWLIYDRVTGTFVNPNHFAHYLAIILPLAFFIAASAWHRAGKHALTLTQRVSALLEGHALLFSFSVLASFGCIGGILLAQSRGALVAAATGCAAMVSLLFAIGSRRAGSRRRVARAAIAGVAATAAFATLAIAFAAFLGRERTIERFRGLEANPAAMVGRRDEIAAAIAIWRLFPVFGSGAGSFESVVSIVQHTDLEAVYQHAHDDYAELAATTGAVGFVVGAGALFAGLALSLRGLGETQQSWARRAFNSACATSIFIAAVHALFDFNFFMPANAATLAAIAGAAAAVRVRDGEPRSSRAVHDRPA